MSSAVAKMIKFRSSENAEYLDHLRVQDAARADSDDIREE